MKFENNNLDSSISFKLGLAFAVMKISYVRWVRDLSENGVR